MCSKHLIRSGFTLIELLIVIGLLGALATLLLTSWSADRTEILDSSIVQKELHDIQRAFQRFQADCVPKQSDYKLMTLYGLEVLMDCDGSRGWSFVEGWDADRNRGWRGPYIEQEDTQTVDVTDVVPPPDGDEIADNPGQPEPEGSTTTADIAVICTPYVNDGDGIGHYYRVIPEVDDNGTPLDTTDDTIEQLWVVFPSHSGALPGTPGGPPGTPGDPNSYEHKRRLMLNE